MLSCEDASLSCQQVGKQLSFETPQGRKGEITEKKKRKTNTQKPNQPTHKNNK